MKLCLRYCEGKEPMNEAIDGAEYLANGARTGQRKGEREGSKGKRKKKGRKRRAIIYL